MVLPQGLGACTSQTFLMFRSVLCTMLPDLLIMELWFRCFWVKQFEFTWATNGSYYSRMDQVKFVEDSF